MATHTVDSEPLQLLQRKIRTVYHVDIVLFIDYNSSQQHAVCIRDFSVYLNST